LKKEEKKKKKKIGAPTPFGVGGLEFGVWSGVKRRGHLAM